MVANALQELAATLAATLAAAEPQSGPVRGLDFFDNLCLTLRKRRELVVKRDNYKLTMRGILGVPPTQNRLDIHVEPLLLVGDPEARRFRVDKVYRKSDTGFPLYRLYRVGVANHEIYLGNMNPGNAITSVPELLKTIVERILKLVRGSKLPPDGTTAAAEPQPGVDPNQWYQVQQYMQQKLRTDAMFQHSTGYIGYGPHIGGDTFLVDFQVQDNPDEDDGSFIFVRLLSHFLFVRHLRSKADIDACTMDIRRITTEAVHAARQADSDTEFHAALQRIGVKYFDRGSLKHAKTEFSIRSEPGNVLTFHREIRDFWQKLHTKPTTAAAEPQPQAHDVRGVLALLQRRLHGRIQDTRLTLTPYLYLDVDVGLAGYAEVTVRFAGYLCYVANIQLQGSDVSGVVSAVQLMLKHAVEAARTQPNVDRFSVALGMELQKIQQQSISDARAAGTMVPFAPVTLRYDRVWDPKQKQHQPAAWRALDTAYTSLRGRA